MTINERAFVYGVTQDNENYDELIQGYRDGAKSQHKIDIEKACEALYTIQDLLNADLMDIEKAKEIMTKAMEE